MPRQMTLSEFSRKGGLTRSKKLSAEERKRIASLGGVAARGIPRKPKSSKKKNGGNKNGNRSSTT